MRNKQILFGLNPVLLAGHEILFFGKRGFSKVGRARYALVRRKGEKKWNRVDLSKSKTKVEKEKLVFSFLKKATYDLDVEKKKRKKKVFKRAPSKIKFKLREAVPKVIRSKMGDLIEIEKFLYETPKAIRFVDGKNFRVLTVQDYINSVKNEFSKIHKKYGKTEYYVRLIHQYKGLRSNDIIDPNRKGFGGFSIHRQVFRNKADIEDQFDYVLSHNYPMAFSNYLRFASDKTNFDFVGFIVEVTKKSLSERKRKK